MIHNKQIARLQYISQATPALSHSQAIQAACEAGCKWIQLRVKQQREAVVLDEAIRAKVVCQRFGATLIINDLPNIANSIAADGVHLGLTDAAHQTARTLLGNNAIIGGTANTIEDIRKYAAAGAVDYVGVGPFRFTTTKQKLSPILGLKGYETIINQCQQENIKLPIIAIGGIQLADIEAIMQTGVHGIAVSSLITKAENKKEVVDSIHQIIFAS